MGEALNALIASWERVLPPDFDAYDDADDTLSACVTDLRYVAATGELPPWFREEDRRG